MKSGCSQTAAASYDERAYKASFTLHELEFASHATKFAVSAANQYEVGQRDMTLCMTN